MTPPPGKSTNELTTTAARLIILARDGVINKLVDGHLHSPDDWLPIEGSLEAIARLAHAGYRIVIATNEAGIGRKAIDVEVLLAINARMLEAVNDAGGSIEAVFFCPHAPEDGCDCRKPKPGLLQQIATRLHIDLTDVPVVGDSREDIQAAQAVGALPVLVLTGDGEHTAESGTGLFNVAVFDDLASVADAVLAGPYVFGGDLGE